MEEIGELVRGHAVALLKNVINQVTIDKQFDTKKPCALCFDTGHSFDHCPIMIQPHVLQNAFIKLKLLCNKIRAALNDMEQKASSTFFAVFADVSRKIKSFSSANFLPSS